MKIKVLEIGEFEINDISYSKARELHKENAKVFWSGGEDMSHVNADDYYALLEKVLDYSGIPEKELKKYSMVQVDQILQQCLMEYTGLNPKD